MRNEFTRSLLKYSAERDDCIGRPQRWGDPPPLVVGTPLQAEMEAFAAEVWAEPPRLIWYFLVGGPGNGKSEAVGAFVRHVNSLAEAAGKPRVFDPSSGKHGGAIAYDFPGDLPNGDMWLLQDVSVPKTHGSDPAKDLLASLELSADPGMHLLACANRGMLLRAKREARKNGGHEWLVELLEKIDLVSREDARAADAKWQFERGGKSIEVRVWPLDHESVLFGEHSGNPWADPTGSLLDKVVIQAVEKKRWEQSGCDDCTAREVCPFFNDAKWLRDNGRRVSFLRILRNAEVWSGQRVVLREALGLLSLVLVGCPSDFVEGTTELHPCDWVTKRVTGTPSRPRDERATLELVSHRIYEDLFARPAPSGIALDAANQRRDRWILKRLESLGPLGKTVASSAKQIDRDFAKQAGPLRLVGIDGILQPFDPSRDNAWCVKHSIASDGEISSLKQIGATHQCALEQNLAELFQHLEGAAKALSSHEDPAKAFAALYRWASTFYLRLAGTAFGETPNADSIAAYLGLLQKPHQPVQAAGQQMQLRDLMRAAAGSGQQVALAPAFVTEMPPLQPKPSEARVRGLSPRWPANDRLALRVASQGTQPVEVLLTAKTFVDIWRKQFLQVAEWNISPAMESLMRAWRDDYLVTQGQFRGRDIIEFQGDPPIVFEIISPTEIQVRPQ